MPEPPAGACIRPSCPKTRAAPGASHLSHLVDLAVELELDEARVLDVDEPADRLAEHAAAQRDVRDLSRRRAEQSRRLLDELGHEREIDARKHDLLRAVLDANRVLRPGHRPCLVGELAAAVLALGIGRRHHRELIVDDQLERLGDALGERRL